MIFKNDTTQVEDQRVHSFEIQHLKNERKQTDFYNS